MWCGHSDKIIWNLSQCTTLKSKYRSVADEVDGKITCRGKLYSVNVISLQIKRPHILPPPSRNCSDTFFDRSFTYGAPYEWNKLDERVRRLSNFNLFKSEIKTVLFLRYFNS